MGTARVQRRARQSASAATGTAATGGVSVNSQNDGAAWTVVESGGSVWSFHVSAAYGWMTVGMLSLESVRCDEEGVLLAGYGSGYADIGVN